MNELEFLIKEQGINIRVYVANETTTDPNYNEKIASILNSIPLRALVSDISYAKAIWRMPGIKSSQVKEITCNKRYRNLIEKSHKIQIGNNYYYGYKPANGDKIQIKECGDYIIVLVITNETL